MDLGPGQHGLENRNELHEHTCIMQTLRTLDAAICYGQHYIGVGEECIELDGPLALLDGLELR
jgi:hypothetical protein